MTEAVVAGTKQCFCIHQLNLEVSLLPNSKAMPLNIHSIKLTECQIDDCDKTNISETLLAAMLTLPS